MAETAGRGPEEIGAEDVESAEHSRIAEHYLDAFGGLARDLPVLGGDPSAAGVDDGYPLRQLARHLTLAGRHDDLHTLLTRSHTGPTGEVGNVWYRAHEAAGTTELFLADLDRARRHAESLTDAALAAERPEPAFATEIRYALMAASLRDRGSDGDSGRIQALGALAVRLSDETRPAALREVLAAVPAVPEERIRGLLLTELVGVLPVELWREALAAAHTLTFTYRRAAVLAALAVRLAPEERREAVPELLAAVRRLKKDSECPGVLEKIADGLPAPYLAEVLAAVRAIDGENYREQALKRVVPHLPAELWGEALSIAGTITSGTSRWVLLAELAEHLPPEWRAEALAVAREIADEQDRERALTALAVRLPEPQRQEVLREALALARSITDPCHRAQALGEVVRGGLTAERATDVVREALAILRAAPADRDSDRVVVLRELDNSLPEKQRPLSEEEWPQVAGEVLATIRTLLDEADRAEALGRAAERLPAERRTDVAREALDVARTIAEPAYRASALAKVVACLPAGERPGVVRESLAATRAIGSEMTRAVVLSDLPLSLPPELAGEALAAAHTVDSERYRAALLSALAGRLPAESRGEVLAAVRSLTEESARASALRGCAEHLPVELLPEVVSEARALTDERGRAEVLVEVVGRLPEEQRRDVVPEVLPYGFDSYEERGRVAAYLSPGQVADAVAAIAPLDEWDRDEALRALATYLPVELLNEALVSWPPGDVDNVLSLLGRAQDAYGRRSLPCMVSVVRRHLALANRDDCQRLVRTAHDTDDNLLEVMAAVDDVHRWWP
ncbi:hypothetical protein [Plantactinospora mayteni]|uniref:HEAT repeat domain-containing protein n=1 Tax=Plantactinospora mayteni TaxID=566021 RepID=A0ABQ4EWY9_9ACTN|nr:hypothetical protein [Plantactinospora mayteni]GIG99183.1 hypothetical protein Pma05_57560 [Plantactinospora mayteni]